MQPLGILETALYVDDLEVAKKFYQEVLGLKINSEKPGRHVFFHSGEGILLLFNSEESQKLTGFAPPHGSHGPGHVAFSIEPASFDTWKSHLTIHKVQIEREVNWSNGALSIYFRDPSGNSLELTTPKTWDM